MEGSYSRVWALCRPSTTSSSTPATLPSPEFAFFVGSLVDTVRNEIASCDERAYESLPVGEAKMLLFFDEEKEVREFAVKVSGSGVVDPGRRVACVVRRLLRNEAVEAT